ncbi:Hypp3796 [Branchiostoma lanceolatum]|uniref:Hypp3796 protein n=1 Tax=Branchiostoma lanceolatum TaxID=7740 RepID=A0A8K0EYH1_BRALA|nr:Hypp3796 [Branchiostoma lanceolatum]
MCYRSDETEQTHDTVDEDHENDTDSSASSTGEAEMYFGEESEGGSTPERQETPERKFSGIKIEFKARVENSGNQLTEMLQARGILKTKEDGIHSEQRFREDGGGLTTL